jgi:peptidoglycan/LPS O-acetylase OafA/YrhL
MLEAMASTVPAARQGLLSSYLDMVRFCAAVAVVLGHARMHAFGPRDTGVVSAGAKLLYLTSTFAHNAVIIFFVISGYLVGGKLYLARRPGFGPKYLLDRATRIYTVVVPALLFGFAAMLVQQHFYGHAFQLTSDDCRGTAGQLMGSMVFLHRGFMETPCFDGPFWSLIYEVFYYLFFFSLAVALSTEKRSTRWAATAAFIGLGVYGLFEPHTLYAYSTIWLLGMVAAQPHPFRRPQILFTLSVAGLFFLQSAIRIHDPVTKWEVLATILMLGSIFLLRRWQPFDLPVAIGRVFTLGAAMSYSLYLAHAPAMNLLRGVLEGSFGIHLGIPISQGTPMFWYLIFLLTGLVAGWACWVLFERHTMTIRKAVEQWAGISRPSGHQPIPANEPVEGRPELPPRKATQTAGGQ